MTTLLQQCSIEQAEWERFCKRFKDGGFGQQRLGQAFYNHFSLHKISDQSPLHNLYAKDGEHAKSLIKQLFNLH